MGNNSIVEQFKAVEIQKIGENLYPKIGGRLRMAHEESHNLSIETSIIKYDGNTAIVKAVATTVKGAFTGHGMASIERDPQATASLIELAENRAIARSLRFAGYGVEYCCAELFSDVGSGNGHARNGNKPVAAQNQPQNGSSNVVAVKPAAPAPQKPRTKEISTSTVA